MSKDEPSLAPQYAVSELSITVSPIWPLYQQSPCAVWQKWKTQREAGDNVRLQRVEASACHAEGLEGQRLLPSLTAVVNQANHSTPEFNAYDPNPPCSIQPLFPYTSTLTNDRTYNIITQSLYVTHTHTHTHITLGACDWKEPADEPHNSFWQSEWQTHRSAVREAKREAI